MKHLRLMNNTEALTVRFHPSTDIYLNRWLLSEMRYELQISYYLSLLPRYKWLMHVDLKLGCTK